MYRKAIELLEEVKRCEEQQIIFNVHNKITPDDIDQALVELKKPIRGELIKAIEYLETMALLPKYARIMHWPTEKIMAAFDTCKQAAVRLEKLEPFIG